MTPERWGRRALRLARRGLAGCAALMGAALPRPAAAWNESGHLQIAAFVYDALSPAAQQRWVALLEQHPRFDADFVAQLPADASDGAARSRWFFLRAAVWPDVARGQPAFERGRWHYVNLPLTLGASGLVSCRQARADFPESQRRVAALRAQKAPAPAAPPCAVQPGAELTPTQPADVREALRWARQTFGDESLPAPQRALALSWLLHLVGDAHQPLHGVALFTPRLEQGDRGGNEIESSAGSLHHVWDGLLGEDTSLAAIQQATLRWRQSPELRELARAARSNLDVDAWLDEDCALARSSVYAPVVLSAVRRWEAGSAPGKPEAALDAAYQERAGRAAERRAVQAAARLVALLERAGK